MQKTDLNWEIVDESQESKILGNYHSKCYFKLNISITIEFTVQITHLKYTVWGRL